MNGGSWCIPRLATGIPGVLSTSGALAPRHMSALALAAHSHGVPLPAGKFTSLKDTLTRQWKSYVDATCGQRDPLMMSMGIEVTEEEAKVTFSAQSDLNTFRLKPVIAQLNDALPGLGWLVYDIVAKANDDDFPIYSPREIGDYASYMWFHSCWTDEDMAEEVRCMDDGLDDQSIVQLRETYAHPWPSDLIASVDGHGWMLGAASYSKGKFTPVGVKRSPRASIDDAHAFIEGKHPADLQALVADALILSATIDNKANPLKGCPFRPRGADVGNSYMDPDDHLMRIGATCFVVWDKPTYSWEAASHFEEFELNGGDCSDAFYVVKADPTNKAELDKLVLATQEIVKRHAMVSRLLQHFPME